MWDDAVRTDHESHADARARAFAEILSRRRLTARFGISSLALLLLRVPVEAAAVKGAKPNRRRKKRRVTPLAPVCPDGAPCGANGSQQCCRGGCCPAGQICAQSQCVIGQGNCPAQVDACPELSGHLVMCSPDGALTCSCRRTTAETARCGEDLPGSVAGECATDRDCEHRYPDLAGVFCQQGCAVLGLSALAVSRCARPCQG